MSTPTGGDSAFLHEMEIEVSEELIVTQSQPLEDSDGVPTAAWNMDPYAQLHEASLRTLLGAIESEEAEGEE